MTYNLEDVTTYAQLQLMQALKLGPAYVDALRMQRDAQILARVQAWHDKHKRAMQLR